MKLTAIVAVVSVALAAGAGSAQVTAPNAASDHLPLVRTANIVGRLHCPVSGYHYGRKCQAWDRRLELNSWVLACAQWGPWQCLPNKRP